MCKNIKEPRRSHILQNVRAAGSSGYGARLVIERSQDRAPPGQFLIFVVSMKNIYSNCLRNSLLQNVLERPEIRPKVCVTVKHNIK